MTNYLRNDKLFSKSQAISEMSNYLRNVKLFKKCQTI